MTESAARAFAGLAFVPERESAAISWHSFDLKTGKRGPQLATPTMGTVGRLIGEPTSVSDFSVRCSDNGTPIVGWDSATLPGRTMLVAINELDDPVWGGMVVTRESDETEWVSLTLVTLEAYFDRRYVTDHDFEATPQGAIVEGILTSDVIPTGVQFTVDAQSAEPRDRTYYDDEDKTALGILQELMGVEGGPEFTVDLEWADLDHTLLNRIVRVRDRIGTAASAPNVRFEMPGSVVSFKYVEDFTVDNGANDVMAVSSGEGDSRPESEHQTESALIAGGWVKYERRFTPSTSITDTQTLDDHAKSELAEMKDGLAELSLEVHLDTGPRVGEDFFLGDDVTAVLTCPRFPETIGPDGDLVAGYTKVVRCIGWDVNYDTRRLIPRLVEVN